MKFILHINPVVPASPEERERLRPIAHRTDKIQEMLAEMTELTQMAEELGFEAVTFSEHHFYTESMEDGLDADAAYRGPAVEDQADQSGTAGVRAADVGSDSAGVRRRMGGSD